MTRGPADPGPDARTVPSPVIPGVALICTVFDEAKSIRAFLESVFSMETLPEEFVIVDGGSTDGTNEAIAEFIGGLHCTVRVVHTIEPECNLRYTPGPVARGRNIAIGLATCGIIAVTDGGCRLDRRWLSSITAPWRGGRDVDVVGGWYLADARTRFEKCLGWVWLTPPGAVDPGVFMPSSRSVAFRKEAWRKAGGYPEHTLLGEDTMFDLALRSAGCTIAYEPGAIVYWRVPHSVRAFSRLAYRYGYGDGSNGIMAGNLRSVLVKLGLAAALVTASVVVHPGFLAGLVAFWIALVGRGRIGPLAAGEFAAFLPCMVFLKLIADGSYLAGYARGRLSPVSPTEMAG